MGVLTSSSSPSSPDKPLSPGRPSIEAAAADTTPDLQLPGDNPPLPLLGSNAPSRKASNSYTPFNLMGTATAAAATATANASEAEAGARGTTTADVTKSDDARSSGTSGGGRATAPLPALPSDVTSTPAAPRQSPAVTPEEPEELYVNADAHIYEGVRQDGPIYENRNVGEYESLNVQKGLGK